jgi:hypothetical protein
MNGRTQDVIDWLLNPTEQQEYQDWLDTIDFRRPTTWDATRKITEGEIFNKLPQERTLPAASDLPTLEHITASTRASR